MAERHSPRTLDSLALAYFLTGDPAKAARTQQQALSLLPPGDSDLRAELERKLERYLDAAREAGLEVDGE
ncbi:MAG: hypothetical protein JXA90_07630 [Planctomycetes bacterium]|nr:hypothetical protein [Planctomycetota bacterium]